MGGSSSTTTTNQNEQATTTPTVPNYALGPYQNYFAGVDNYSRSDPYSYVAPMNNLQQQAYSNAGGLLQAGNLYGQAAQGVQKAVASPLTSAQATQTMAQTGVLGPATQTTAANAGQAAQVGLGGYETAKLGNAAQAATPTLGNAAQTSAASLLDNFQAYQNPYTQQVVDSTLSDFDHQAGIDRARQQAQGAKAGAFGGSRFGIAESALLGEQERARAAAAANLRSSAFNTAAGLSAQDAGMRQQANLFNTGATNQRDETRAGLAAQTGMFNAGQANQFGLARFDASNQANRYSADAANQSQLFNAGAQNDFGMANAGFQQQASLANAAAQNQYGLSQFDATNQGSMFNAGQANQMGQFNAGQTNDMALQDRAQQLQAAGLLGTLAGAGADTYRADLATQADLGQQLWQQEQAQLNAPLTQLQTMGQLLNPSYLDPITQRTVTGSTSGVSREQTSGGLFNSLLGAASVAAPFISDPRAKTNVVKVGEFEDGLGVYDFDYIWGGERQRGVMADEVAELRPWALGPTIAGFASVNYGAL